MFSPTPSGQCWVEIISNALFNSEILEIGNFIDLLQEQQWPIWWTLRKCSWLLTNIWGIFTTFLQLSLGCWHGLFKKCGPFSSRAVSLRSCPRCGSLTWVLHLLLLSEVSVKRNSSSEEPLGGMRFHSPDDSLEDETGKPFITFQRLVWGWGQGCMWGLACKPQRSSDGKNWHLLGKRL